MVVDDSIVMFVIAQLGHEDVGGINTLTKVEHFVPDVIVIACCSIVVRAKVDSKRQFCNLYGDYKDVVLVNKVKDLL